MNYKASLCALALIGSGCGDATLAAPTLDRVVVDPSSARVLHPGDSVRFVAVGVSSNGDRSEVVGIWSSGDTSVAVVQADGWAEARGTGATVVEVEFQGTRGAASLVVHPDTIPPTLERVFASRSRVSVSLGPVVVPITARFRDDDSGVQSAIGLFDGPLGAGITGLITFSADSVESTPSGDVSVHRGALGIPGFVGVGTWTLSALRADDFIGNSRRWGAEDLERMGMTVEIIATTGDGN